MTLTIPGKLTTVKDFLHDLERQLGDMVSHHMQAQLEQDVTRCLYRDRHQRRQRSGRRTSAVCQRCNSRSAYRFSRNGRRPRQLLTSYGVVRLGLPRVVCACGGSVTIPFSILQPHQRWWDDVIEQVGRWAHLGLSLRQMQEEIGQTLYCQ